MSLVHKPYETMEGHGAPAVRQISVFIENRLGQLHRITQLLEQKDIRVLSLSIVDLVDCAVLRLLFDSADEGIRILRDAGFNVTVAEVVVVRLPKGKRGLLTIWSALLKAEVNISYAYPLLVAGAVLKVQRFRRFEYVVFFLLVFFPPGAHLSSSTGSSSRYA